jgi:enoyl-CoA hydratase/carnithine racemase
MAEYKFCTVKDEGRTRIVTLNRPEVMNALHGEAHDELETVWDEFAADNDLWLAIITGAGDRAFSAGNDLKAQAPANARNSSARASRRSPIALIWTNR